MTLSALQAEDEIRAKFFTAWQTGASVIVGYVPEIRWQGVEEQSAIDASKFWCRHSLEIVEEQQSTLSTCEGAPGKKRYTTYGLVFVQIFCPRNLALAYRQGKLLGELAKSAYRGTSTPGGVWFRNATLKPLQPENSYIRFNVSAQFEYDSLA